jgi:hypothetical protein
VTPIFVCVSKRRTALIWWRIYKFITKGGSIVHVVAAVVPQSAFDDVMGI